MKRALMLKRLSPTELSWFSAHEPPEARGPRLDESLREALAPADADELPIRLRWLAEGAVVEEMRRLVWTARSLYLAGAPVVPNELDGNPGERIVAIGFERARDVVHRSLWLLTLDFFGVEKGDGDREAAAHQRLRSLLGPESSLTLLDDDADEALYLARLWLPAFRGSPSASRGSLSEDEWRAIRAWLTEHLPEEQLEQLLRGPYRRVADTVLDLMERGGEDASRERLAEAVLRRFGDELLADRSRREILLAVRFPRPEERSPASASWLRGSSRSRDLVRALGLPPVLAGHAYQPTPEEEVCLALPRLGELHDYQREIASGMRDILRAEHWTDRRGIVWLPTGTGKTRICAETLVSELNLSGRRNCILWIADREELCEQAIAAFRDVWTALGVETPTARNGRSTKLRILRLWGGRSWKAIPNEPTLVVSNIQTLARRADNQAQAPGLAELALRCAAVVFDEAHHVVAPSYARVIQALGLGEEPNALGNTRRNGPPLLGLTATPGRARNDETEELARRFCGRLLEPEEPYRSIRGFIRRGYLARPRLEVVSTGYTLEQLEADRAYWLEHRNFSRRTLERAGGSPGRTAAILRDLEPRLAGLQSVLVFACSVEHAKLLADILSERGHRAASVDGETPRSVRLATVERFREGALKVLATCDLLVTGFDAPNVDAVALSRPVVSRILFAQMVGRGLRGLKNGGTATCLILDYEDNSGDYRDLDELRREFREPWIHEEEESETSKQWETSS